MWWMTIALVREFNSTYMGKKSYFSMRFANSKAKKRENCFNNNGRASMRCDPSTESDSIYEGKELAILALGTLCTCEATCTVWLNSQNDVGPLQILLVKQRSSTVVTDIRLELIWQWRFINLFIYINNYVFCIGLKS